MSNRQPLQGEIYVRAAEADGGAKKTFRIIRLLDDSGASALCYSVVDQSGKRGVLKEFYPQNCVTLYRRDDGVLLCKNEPEDILRRYTEARAEYLQPYRFISQRLNEASSADSASVIPNFEFYTGCDASYEPVGGCYIWMPEYTPYQKVCEAIRRSTDSDSYYNLTLILKSMRELAECALVLHREGIVHRDIKPANFGFLTRNHKLLEQTLTLFDLDSVCTLHDHANTMGTPGFMDEDSGEVNQQSDIYSIGATLFYSIVNPTNQEVDAYYRDEYLDDIPDIVASSRLIRACEKNASPYLRYKLQQILFKCLCRRSERYDSCVPLIKDIDAALECVMPIRKTANGTWTWRDTEKRLEGMKNVDTRLAIQLHFYKHPIYRMAKGEEINVLLLGLGGYGQRFLDDCLQTGQVVGKTLNVTAVSARPEDIELYLNDRPSLKDFFNVTKVEPPTESTRIPDAEPVLPNYISGDGSLVQSEDNYGNIRFIHMRLENEDAWFDCLADHEENAKATHYIFIALGDDSLNRKAASYLRNLIAAEKAVIAYVWEGEVFQAGIRNDIIPVCVSQDVHRDKDFIELERLAFNTHLVWTHSMAVDLDQLYAEFKRPYYYHASIDSALAIKSKLFGFEIDLEKRTFEEAAEEFTQALDLTEHDAEWQDIRRRLIWLEHRRWVTQMLCEGYRPMSVDECVKTYNGETRSAIDKRHICLCHSESNLRLMECFYAHGVVDADHWDNAKAEELAILDPLDRLSLTLHQAYLKEAESALMKDIIDGPVAQRIHEIVQVNHRVQLAWFELLACMRDIRNRQNNRLAQFKPLQKAFLKEAESELSPELSNEIVKQFESLITDFKPLLKRAEYRDWKYEDVKLIDQIPFILTYAAPSYMVIPYVTGTNSELFQNVAAPTVVNPTTIIYLYHCDSDTDLSKLTDSIPGVRGYLLRKNIRATVEFLITCIEGTMDPADAKRQIVAAGEAGAARAWQMKDFTDTEIERLRRKSGIAKVRIIEVPDRDKAAGAFRKALAKRKQSRRVFALEENDSPCSWMLHGASAYNHFSHYRFDAKTLQFQDVKGCEMFGYVKKTAGINVGDMMAFRRSSSDTVAQPEFFDHFEELWKLSRDSGGFVWKDLCKTLKLYSEQADRVASVSHKRGSKTDTEVHRYTIPYAARET